MPKPENIKIADYSYILPESKIAKFPMEKRDTSKLLIYKNGYISHKQFLNLPEILPLNSFLVFNNTKVIQARLLFKKDTGAEVEIFCLEPVIPSDYALNFQQKTECRWKCIIGNLKRWKKKTIETIIDIGNDKINFVAKKIEATHDGYIIEFSWDKQLPFCDILDVFGKTPIPPYLNRKATILDKETYQTVYSKIQGSVAAPTAGLHFTEQVICDLYKRKIQFDEITLHVGAGTFKPVKSELIADHEMHTEHFEISEHFIRKLIKNAGNIVAVGTTTVRTLESLYWIGVKILNGKIHSQNDLIIKQWEIYQLNQNFSLAEALDAIILFLSNNQITTLLAATQIIIVPGYKFRVVNTLITNFHQPQSTLLLLVAAFTNNNWKSIYDYAFENDFRFLSYGDSSILFQN